MENEPSWKQALAIRGLAYQATVGTLSSPITGGGAGTVIVLRQSELRISVPSGTSIILLRIRVDCQIPISAADSDESEILIAVAVGQAITDGTDTLETPVNMRTGSSQTTATTVNSATTADHASPTLDMELAHAVKIAQIEPDTPTQAGEFHMWNDLWLEYEPEVSPVIDGPSTVLVYWGGTVATTGFCSAEWAEFANQQVQ